MVRCFCDPPTLREFIGKLESKGCWKSEETQKRSHKTAQLIVEITIHILARIAKHIFLPLCSTSFPKDSAEFLWPLNLCYRRTHAGLNLRYVTQIQH